MEEKIKFDDSFDKVEFGPVDAGEYEVVLKAERRTTKDGSKDFLSLDFKIRDDVNQNFRGRHVFDTAWRDKNRPLWFDLIKLNKLVKTQKGTETYKDEFSDVDECILYLNGLNMRITIEKEYDNVTGKEINKVKFLSYVPSHTLVEERTETSPVEMPDSELPF